MLCPNPNCVAMPTPPRLVMADRHGIEIDYCPNCRGVWLDRGELDKIIERAAAELAPPAPAPTPVAPPPVAAPPAWQQHDSHKHHDSYKHHDKHYKSHGDHYYGKRKKSLLSELFDFD
jgi:Zn-finger nucleic acid-binding protein